MTPAEAARLLAVAAIYDKRTVGEMEANAWADALDDLTPRACAEAIREHYATETVWLMPAHVRNRVVAKVRDQKRHAKDQATLRGIEEATARYDRDRSYAAYLETRRAFDEAISRTKTAEADEAAS